MAQIVNLAAGSVLAYAYILVMTAVLGLPIGTSVGPIGAPWLGFAVDAFLGILATCVLAAAALAFVIVRWVQLRSLHVAAGFILGFALLFGSGWSFEQLQTDFGLGLAVFRVVESLVAAGAIALVWRYVARIKT